MAVTFLCLLTLAAKDKKGWYNSTPYLEWTDKQVTTMLSKSPWTQTYTHVTGDTTEIVTGAPQVGSSTGVDSSVQTKYHFHFHWLSAKPVRMAFARRAMEANPQLAPQQLQGFVDQEPEHAVLAMRIESRPAGSPLIRVIEQKLERINLERLSQDTQLTTKSGKKIALKEYLPPEDNGMGSRFVFPRTTEDGSPLLTEEDGEIRFTTRFAIPESNLRIRLKYKLKDMLFQGNLEY